MKRNLFATQSVLLLIITVGYVGLTFFSLIKWNETVSAALISGFIIFAQQSVTGFFMWLHGTNDAPPATPDNKDGKQS